MTWRDLTPTERIALITRRQRNRRARGLGVDHGWLSAEGQRQASEERLERIRAKVRKWEGQYK